MKKILLTIILGMFLLSFVYAASIGEFEQSTDIQLFQTCNNCTFCNFTSIKLPNSSEILINVETIKRNTHFSFDLDKGNTSVLGFWLYCYECGNGVDTSTGCIDFRVTPTGEVIDIPKAIFYVLLAVGVFLMFSLSLYFNLTLSSQNIKNDDGDIIRVSRVKYLKFMLILVTYPLFLWLLNILIFLSRAFINSTILFGFFSFLFDVLLRLSVFVFIFVFVVIVFNAVRDSNIKDTIKRFGKVTR